VGRCALFVPLFAKAFECSGKPLAIIEVGSSGGFGLLWPHLSYDYGSRGQVGEKDAPLTLRCRVFGGRGFRIPITLPPVVRQIGLELTPFDLGNDEDTRWLIALTAPNNLMAQEQVRTAIALARRDALEVRPGCVLDTLERAFGDLPGDSTCMVFHSLTAHHLQEQGKLEQYKELLGRLSCRRSFFQATVEWGSYAAEYGKPMSLRLQCWEMGRTTCINYGFTDPAADGRWVRSV